MKSIVEKLECLRERAAPLETSPAERATGLKKAGQHTERFLGSLPDRRVYAAAGPREDAMAAFALAEYFHEQVGKIPGIERGPKPDLSIVTFRFRTESGDSDTASKALAQAINEDGRVFFTSTTIAGRFTIRMAILTYNTHLEDVRLALQVIRECAATIDCAMGGERA